jgi:hypothetical protein
MKPKFWLLFAGVQGLGFILPFSANIHSHPLPLIAGVLVLLPGSLASVVLPDNFFGEVISVPLILGINGYVWYRVARPRRKANNATPERTAVEN